MRVLGVVLCVAVLLCFFNSAFAQCNDNGYKSGEDLCICNSGFKGADCEEPLSETCTAKDVDPRIATDFPKLNDAVEATTFTHNVLKAEILNPFVDERVFLSLNFTGASAKECALGSVGSFWTKKLVENGTVGCADVFELNLPWGFHKQCGFTNDSRNFDANLLVLTGRLMIQYRDFIDVVDGFNLTRKVHVPYQMSVKFPKTIVVELLSLNITSDVHYGVGLTADQFEPETGVLTLELTTILNYPNMFHNYYTKFTHPDSVDVINGTVFGLTAYTSDVLPQHQVGEDRDVDNVILCTFLRGTCKQKWNIKLTAKNCTFDGNYTVTYRLQTCRGSQSTDIELDCTFIETSVNFSISTSNTCGAVHVKPEVTGHLLAFRDTVDFANIPNIKSSATDKFALGQYAKLYADIDSQGNDLTLIFDEIKFWKKNGTTEPKDLADSDWTYLYKDRAPHVATPYLNNTRLEVFNSLKGFRVYFHSSVFKVKPEGSESFIISAKATLTFLGNSGETKKRNVEYTYESNGMSSMTKVGLSNSAIPSNDAAADKPAVDGVAPVTFIASVVGAVAGTLLIVFVVVGFALRVRNQSDKRDAAASPAVSAANVAAASIEVAVNRN